jgi:hypothetical protein
VYHSKNISSDLGGHGCHWGYGIRGFHKGSKLQQIPSGVCTSFQENRFLYQNPLNPPKSTLTIQQIRQNMLIFAGSYAVQTQWLRLFNGDSGFC